MKGRLCTESGERSKELPLPSPAQASRLEKTRITHGLITKSIIMSSHQRVSDFPGEACTVRCGQL